MSALNSILLPDLRCIAYCLSIEFTGSNAKSFKKARIHQDISDFASVHPALPSDWIRVAILRGRENQKAPADWFRQPTPPSTVPLPPSTIVVAPTGNTLLPPSTIVVAPTINPLLPPSTVVVATPSKEKVEDETQRKTAYQRLSHILKSEGAESMPTDAIEDIGKRNDIREMKHRALLDILTIRLPRYPIIGIAGRIGSGKTYLADAIQSHISCPTSIRSFATPLKRCVESMCGLEPNAFDDPKLKSQPCPSAEGKTYGRILQIIGGDARRDLSSTFWIDRQLAHRDEGTMLIIDDVRFLDEAIAIEKAGGIVIRVDGPIVLSSDGRDPTDSSEVSLIDYPFRMTVQYRMTLNEIHSLVDRYLEPSSKEFKKTAIERLTPSIRTLIEMADQIPYSLIK